MVADRAAYCRSSRAMVTGIVPGDTPDHRPFNAPLRIGRDRRESNSQCQRYTTEDRFHRGRLLYLYV